MAERRLSDAFGASVSGRPPLDDVLNSTTSSKTLNQAHDDVLRQKELHDEDEGQKEKKASTKLSISKLPPPKVAPARRKSDVDEDDERAKLGSRILGSTASTALKREYSSSVLARMTGAKENDSGLDSSSLQGEEMPQGGGLVQSSGAGTATNPRKIKQTNDHVVAQVNPSVIGVLPDGRHVIVLDNAPPPNSPSKSGHRANLDFSTSAATAAVDAAVVGAPTGAEYFSMSSCGHPTVAMAKRTILNVPRPSSANSRNQNTLTTTAAQDESSQGDLNVLATVERPTNFLDSVTTQENSSSVSTTETRTPISVKTPDLFVTNRTVVHVNKTVIRTVTRSTIGDAVPLGNVKVRSHRPTTPLHLAGRVPRAASAGAVRPSSAASVRGSQHFEESGEEPITIPTPTGDGGTSGGVIHTDYSPSRYPSMIPTTVPIMEGGLRRSSMKGGVLTGSTLPGSSTHSSSGSSVLRLFHQHNHPAKSRTGSVAGTQEQGDQGISHFLRDSTSRTSSFSKLRPQNSTSGHLFKGPPSRRTSSSSGRGPMGGGGSDLGLEICHFPAGFGNKKKAVQAATQKAVHSRFR